MSGVGGAGGRECEREREGEREGILILMNKSLPEHHCELFN